MKPVVMYFKPSCPYCQRAHFLLDEKGVRYEGINLTEQPQRRDEMIERANGRNTVPQIFIGDQHIGGYDDLNALESANKLDALLADN